MTSRRTSKTNTMLPDFRKALETYKRVIPQALELARATFKQMAPPPPFRRRLNKHEMLLRYLRMTPQEHEALRQRVGDERYRAYTIAMSNLYQKLRREQWQ